MNPSIDELLSYWLPLAEEAYSHSDVPMLPDDFGIVRERSEGATEIALRGTQSIEEWLRDAQSVDQEPDRYSFGSDVATGFQAVYSGIRVAIFDLLRNPRSVRITGHSLGAALAVALAAELRVRDPLLPITVVTLAGPRYGSRQWAERYEAAGIHTLRITNEWDSVPHLPLKFRFKHVGEWLGVDPGFQDVVQAHGLQTAYRPGLQKLLNAGR